MVLVRRSLLVLCVTLSAISLFAQATSGTLVGTVTTEGRPLPGVTVSIASPALQGTRSTVTGDSGGYHFPALPPGDYTVTFELEGMQRLEQRVAVSLAQTSRADAEMRVAAVAEAITITAAAPAAIETSEVSSNFDVEMVRELPLARDIRDTVLIAPGVTEAAVNDQITISGAMSFDNLFLVNGVVVNENLRGQPHALFIEDAIQETTILTGGVSAEYGRFTGGVVSTLTKSGGNDFSGSVRDTLTNPNWTEVSEFGEPDPIDEIDHTYEATLGGRFIRDRLWFFGAGRLQDRQFSEVLRLTEIPYVRTDEDERWELKLTGQVAPQHTVTASYLQSDSFRNNIITFGPAVDERSLTTRDQPKTLLGINYNGIFAENLLIEAQYSRMDDDLSRGAKIRDLIEGTLLRDATTGNRMWSPSGCGDPCPIKQHDNKMWIGKASYFLSTRATGSHNLVGGFEEFHQLRNDNNFQSGSDFWLHGHIIQDPTNKANLSWGIDPSNGAIEWDPVPALSQTSDFAVRSFFANDKWDLNEHWNFNIGVRYDEAFGTDQAGTKTVDDSAWSPRLAATFDPQGTGRHRFSATYGRYVSKVEQGPADLTAQAGRYRYYLFDYQGPAINPVGTPFNQLVPIPQVIRQVFDWFEAQGGTNATHLLTRVSIPGYTSRFEKSLNAPYMDEITVGYGIALGSRGFLRADYIDRNWGDFYVIRRTLDTGTATDPSGLVVDQGVIENSRGGLSRDYQAVQLQGSYRIRNRLNIGGNYTWSELIGNVIGETSSGATTLTANPDRPEYTGFEQNNPVGYLDADMRHRANLWISLDFPTPIGEFNVSLLERYHSGLSYSAAGTVDVRRASNFPEGVPTNLGYRTVPTNVTYFFSERGAFRLDDITSTDVGLNYVAPIGGVRLFVEIDALNVFNEQGLEDPDFVDRTVLTHRSSTCRQVGTNAACARFQPFTQTPQEGVHWRYGPNFGKPTTPDAYQLPRTYRASFGVRF